MCRADTVVDDLDDALVVISELVQNVTQDTSDGGELALVAEAGVSRIRPVHPAAGLVSDPTLYAAGWFARAATTPQYRYGLPL
jgi:hypothetical protein